MDSTETKSKVVNTYEVVLQDFFSSYGVDVHKGIGTITKDKNVPSQWFWCLKPENHPCWWFKK